METLIRYDKVKEFTSSANRLISNNVLEDVLRHNLSSWMPQMFPNNPWWISVHISGSETLVNYATITGSNRGFVDSLVGKTVIEYEKNLSNNTIFNTGYNQVKDYCSALLNQGVNQQDIIGVLSDTIRWFAYKISRIDNLPTGQLYGKDNIDLEEIDHIHLREGNDIEINKFVRFILRYIGREGSRPLNAFTLTGDMGFESQFCHKHIQEIASVVQSAFETNKVYAELIKNI